MTPAHNHPAAPPRSVPAHSTWPGFPFPPPLLGVAPTTVAAASARWLREVIVLLDTGAMDLSTLFAKAPVQLALNEHNLPESCLPLVTGAGMYALGAVTPTGPRTLPALFAAPRAVHRGRLADAIDLLAAG